MIDIENKLNFHQLLTWLELISSFNYAKFTIDLNIDLQFNIDHIKSFYHTPLHLYY